MSTPPPDPLLDACGEEPGAICEWVYESSDGNETLAKLSDWLVSRPLQILLILLVAWIASFVARRWTARAVRRIVNPDTEAASRGLRRLGMKGPARLTAQLTDPRRETRAQAISAVVAGTVAVAIWVIATIMVAGQLNVDVAPLIASAGIAGVALGFGAQTLVRDWIAGLFMLIEDQYGIGDVVDLGEASGVVERFSLRATVLRGVDGTVWHVPNGVVVRVGNRSQLWSVALLDVSVAYQSDLDAVRNLLRDTAIAVCEQDEFRDQVLEPPQVLGVEALAPDGITLRLTVKTTPGSQWGIQRALREAVKTSFDAAGVEIPFPQRTVWMKNEPVPDSGNERLP
jgi:small conductance mechanosensitive channel